MASLSEKLIGAYNETRGENVDRTVLCHAPFTSMNFEQTGKANACCYNRTHVLGEYPRDSLEQMWFSAAAEQLRGYIRQDSLEGGCSMCRRQLESGNLTGCKARIYDQYAQEKPEKANRALTSPLPARVAAMPRVMEFELENTCNLQCIMCDGYFSSAIRRHREKQPPQLSPYDADFVKQLVEFMPHLEEMKFLGGEPLMIGIYYDIWEEAARVNPGVKIHITTNATTLNPRTKKLLEKMLGAGLEVSFNVSIDSVGKETYEAIRVGACYEQVMENIAWLSEYTKKRNAHLGFSVCPMVINRFEIPDLVRFAERERHHRDLQHGAEAARAGAALPELRGPRGTGRVLREPHAGAGISDWEDQPRLLHGLREPGEGVEGGGRQACLRAVREAPAHQSVIPAAGVGADAEDPAGQHHRRERPAGPAAAGPRTRRRDCPKTSGPTSSQSLSETTPEQFWDAYLACLDWVASECLPPAEYRDFRHKSDALQRMSAGLVASAKRAILSDLLKGDVVGHLSFILATDLAAIEGGLQRYREVNRSSALTTSRSASGSRGTRRPRATNRARGSVVSAAR